MKSLISIVVFGSIVLTAACLTTSTSQLFAQNTSPVTAKTAAPPTAATKTVKLDEGSWADLKKFVAKQKGKVVVVDLWSTSCMPCMKEFPHLVELSVKHPRKLVCVSFSCDFYGVAAKPPSYYRPRVEKFLKSKKATFKNYLSTTPSDDLFDEIKLASIPAVLVFGPDGKLAKRFDNDELEDDDDPFSYKKHINPLVEKLAKTVKLKK